MGWLKSLVCLLKKKDSEECRLANVAHWELTSPADYSKFLRMVTQILPPGCVLYVEGTSIAPEVRAFLEDRKTERIRNIGRGTILPRPGCFHILATQENMAQFARLAGLYPEPEVCDHLVIYGNDGIYVEWYDALYTDPVSVSTLVPEGTVREFCQAVGCSFVHVGQSKD